MLPENAYVCIYSCMHVCMHVYIGVIVLAVGRDVT
jgi:hypothetical protein